MESNFQPFDIDETITIDSIIENIKADNHLTALVMALKMNEHEVISKVYQCIPIASVPLIANNIP